jgi:hypothetical protein
MNTDLEARPPERLSYFKQALDDLFTQGAKNTMGPIGAVLKQAQEELGTTGWPRLEYWLGNSRNFGRHAIDLALDIHGEVIVPELANCGLPLQRVRKMTKADQRLLIDPAVLHRVKEPDATIVEKPFRELTDWQLKQLIDIQGRFVPAEMHSVEMKGEDTHRQARIPDDKAPEEATLEGRVVRLKAGKIVIAYGPDRLANMLGDDDFETHAEQIAEVRAAIQARRAKQVK